MIQKYALIVNQKHDSESDQLRKTTKSELRMMKPGKAIRDFLIRRNKSPLNTVYSGKDICFAQRSLFFVQ